jgi:hypothetical protein
VVVVPDEVLKQKVETALHDDPFFPDMHVEVKIKTASLTWRGSSLTIRTCSTRYASPREFLA